MIKYLYFCFFCLALASSSATAQDEFKTYVDLHVGSITRPFYTQDSIDGIKYNLWQNINNECGVDKSPELIDKLGSLIPRFSQANFEEMARGNVRIFCVALSPIELQFLENNTYLTDKNKRATIACLTGVYAAHLLLRAKEADYFQVLIRQLFFIEKYEGQPYYINGKAYSYKIIRKQADIDSVLNNPYKLGVILTIEGGHALGHSVYINNIAEGTAPSGIDKEYQDLLSDNIARLKGNLPLAYTNDIYLNSSIFYVTLAKTFPNALGGTSLSFNRNQLNYIARPNGLYEASTSLGYKVIQDLVSEAKGVRKIIIDIQHMSLDFRKHYYDHVSRFSLMGTSLPIIASHTGISGLPWTSPLYKKKDDDSKNTDYLNHWQQNLGKTDIDEIYSSQGIIGITLDKNVLGGALALNRINTAVPNSNRQRTACLELFLANVFKVIQTVNKKGAWDIVAIGSNFDAMSSPLDAYPTARHLRNLHADIQNFLDNPTAIAEDATGLSIQEINRLKFGYTGIEIADKILWRNSLNFLRKHFKEAQKPNSSPPK
jgi:microsomal dipeptidase-like Zn-dependent dipeptidase